MSNGFFFFVSVQGTLMPGSLIQLQSAAGLDTEMFYFLGVLMKKPRMHVLIKGFYSPLADGTSRVGILEPSSGKCIFFTSSQVFASLLNMPGSFPSSESIPFVVHTYAVPSFEPLLGVRLTTASERKHFSTSKMPTKASKAKAAKPVRLPLGLTESPRKRKRGKPMAGQGSTVKKARATTTTKGSSGRDNSSIGVVREIDPDIAALLAGQNQEPSSEEDSDLDSTDSDNHSDSDSSDSSDSSADLAGDDLAEQPFLTPEAAEEERQISLVTQSHCQLMELRGEPVHLQASVPDNSGLDEVKALAKAGKTFCNQVVGLVELGVQANNRLATCRHCNTKIARGGVRFGYSYNVRKFHAWVHAGCIVSYLSEQKANIQQAFEFLEDMETKDYPANVKTEICNVKRGLKSLAG